MLKKIIAFSGVAVAGTLLIFGMASPANGTTAAVFGSAVGFDGTDYSLAYGVINEYLDKDVAKVILTGEPNSGTITSPTGWTATDNPDGTITWTADTPSDYIDTGVFNPATSFGYDAPDAVVGTYKVYDPSDVLIGEGDILAAVPVELTAFSATAEADGVRLTWVTQSETENQGFDLLRGETRDGAYERINSRIIEGAGYSATARRYEYVDRELKGNRQYFYKLVDIDFSGAKETHGPIGVFVQAPPSAYVLEQNFPNPFDASTTIRFSLKEAGLVSLRVYSVTGQLVRELVNEERSAGVHSVAWDATNKAGVRVATGVYLFTLEINGFRKTQSMVFSR